MISTSKITLYVIIMITILWYLWPCSLVCLATVYQTTRHRFSNKGNILMRCAAYGAYIKFIINALCERRHTCLVLEYFNTLRTGDADLRF